MSGSAKNFKTQANLLYKNHNTLTKCHDLFNWQSISSRSIIDMTDWELFPVFSFYNFCSSGFFTISRAYNRALWSHRHTVNYVAYHIVPPLHTVCGIPHSLWHFRRINFLAIPRVISYLSGTLKFWPKLIFVDLDITLAIP